MRDAVADVLLQRQRLNGTRPYHFAASLGLHLLLAVGVIYAALNAPTVPSRHVVSVRLAGSAKAAAGGGMRQATSTKRAPKPAKQPEKKVPEKSVATPEVPKKPVKSARDTGLFGRSELPAPRGKGTPEPSAGSSGGSVVGSGIGAVPGIGKAGVTGLEGGDFPYPTYIDRMIQLVGTRWFRPKAGDEALVQIYFEVERNGRVREAKIEKSSGSSVFDRAALRAVIESSPLPPLPPGYSGTYLGIHLTFH